MGFVSGLGAERYERWKSAVREALPLTRDQIRELKQPLARLHQKYLEDFIFIHINKAGGTSIERALGIPFLNHDTLQERIAHIGRARASRRFKFAFVRHPLDRTISLFHYRTRKRETGHLPLPERREAFQSWAWSMIVETGAAHKMVMPQLHWLLDEEGCIGVDFIGRFERLEEDFEQVRRRIGKAKPLPRLKSRTARGARDIDWWYGTELRSKLTDIYAVDFEAFGYGDGQAARARS